MAERRRNRFPFAVNNRDHPDKDPKSGVWSISISEPGKERRYCVGFLYLGGERTNPASWSFDHVRVYRDKRDNHGWSVSQGHFSKFLDTCGYTVDDLLAHYCRLMGSRPTRRRAGSRSR